ncbi:MAG: UvrB/UvrC motif-containing protein [Clostridia bacterium]|nr:UvrB/UvrC motif-containing protein [Clostridia bacterium]
MKCDNCGKDNANVKYFQNINGEKKEMNLCEECSKKLGIDTNINFDIPIDFSSFLGGFFEDFGKEDFPYLLSSTEEKRCEGCNSTFEDILNKGKFGCPTCYETFESQIDNLLNKIHGGNRHIGRLGSVNENKANNVNNTNNANNADDANDKAETNETFRNPKENKIEKLKAQLKELVSQEKYEEAAKVRDEIKKIAK